MDILSLPIGHDLVCTFLNTRFFFYFVYYFHETIIFTEDQVNLSTETDSEKDFRFTKWMIKNVGVQMIPPSAFYNKTNKHLAEKFVRVCFFKRDENLQKGTHILKNWVKTIAPSKSDDEYLPNASV